MNWVLTHEGFMQGCDSDNRLVPMGESVFTFRPFVREVPSATRLVGFNDPHVGKLQP